MMDKQTELPYSIHQLSASQPSLKPARYRGLVASIFKYGLRHPIVVRRGQVVDGGHRLRPCIEAGVEPEYKFLDDDLREHFATEGLPFREMNSNARGIVGHYLSEESTRGRPPIDEDNCANLRIKQKEAADLVGVSLRLVSDASRMLSEDSKAEPVLRQAVREWKIRVTDAARVVELPPEVQERAVGLVLEGRVKTAKEAAQCIERETAEAEEAAGPGGHAGQGSGRDRHPARGEGRRPAPDGSRRQHRRNHHPPPA